MSAAGDIVLAEVPCISCGYNLHMLAADGRCPECGGCVAETLERTLLLSGDSQIRGIAGAMRLAAYLNIAVIVDLVILILTPAFSTDPQWIGILGLIGLMIFVPLQVIAAVRTTIPLPGESLGWRRRVVLISGITFGAATFVFLVAIIVIFSEMKFEAPLLVGYTAMTILFPGLCVFAWAVGDQYGRLCKAGGMPGKARWCVRIGRVIAVGAGILEIGSVILLWAEIALWEGISSPEFWDSEVADRVMEASVYGGLLVLLIGMLAATILQFMLARRLKKLAVRVGERPVLTGPAAM
jgi:hypothetical protein